MISQSAGFAWVYITTRCLRVQALEKGDKALLVNVDKMAYANLYVTDGDLHVQAVDTLPTPNPRGVFDSQRTNMVGNPRAVPYVDEICGTIAPLPMVPVR